MSMRELALDMQMTKHCPQCQQEKRWGEFSRSDYTLTGRQSWCKACKNAAARERYHRDIEWSRQAQRERRRQTKAFRAWFAAQLKEAEEERRLWKQQKQQEQQEEVEGDVSAQC